MHGANTTALGLATPTDEQTPDPVFTVPSLNEQLRQEGWLGPAYNNDSSQLYQGTPMDERTPDPDFTVPSLNEQLRREGLLGPAYHNESSQAYINRLSGPSRKLTSRP